MTFVRCVSKKVKISIMVLTTNVYKTNIWILIKKASFFHIIFSWEIILLRESEI